MKRSRFSEEQIRGARHIAISRTIVAVNKLHPWTPKHWVTNQEDLAVLTSERRLQVGMPPTKSAELSSTGVLERAALHWIQRPLTAPSYHL